MAATATQRERRELAKAKLRVEELHEQINHHSYRYHVLDDPEVSDADYDAFVGELVELEQRFPELITPESPTQRRSGASTTVMSTVSQEGQRTTVPAARTYTCSSATGRAAPQPPQTPVATVISTPKTSHRRPPIAFPSRYVALIGPRLRSAPS